MSQSFNINQFKSSVSAFCAEKAERPYAFAAFLAENLASALESTLIDGSDAIHQALFVLKNSGKAGLSVKFRKVVNEADWTPLSTWGQVSELAFIKASCYVGGNSQKCTDKDKRRDAVELIRENIKAKGIDIFTPAAKEIDADPLANFGKFNSEKIDEILSRANVDQLSACLSRLQSLEWRVSTALSTINSEAEAKAKAEAEAKAKAEAEAEAKAKAEAEAEAEAKAKAEAEATSETIEPTAVAKVRKNRKAEKLAA